MHRIRFGLVLIFVLGIQNQDAVNCSKKNQNSRVSTRISAKNLKNESDYPCLCRKDDLYCSCCFHLSKIWDYESSSCVTMKLAEENRSIISNINSIGLRDLNQINVRSFGNVTWRLCKEFLDHFRVCKLLTLNIAESNLCSFAELYFKNNKMVLLNLACFNYNNAEPQNDPERSKRKRKISSP